MKKRAISCVLTIALLLSLLATAALAAGTTLTVNTPKTIPKAGEEFTVTVDISGNPGFNSILFTLVFDKNDLTCTGGEAEKLLGGMLYVMNPDAPEGAIVAAASDATRKGDGTLASFTFKANRDLSGFSFSIADAEIENAEGNMVGIGSGVDTATTNPTPATTPTTPSNTTPATTPVEQSAPEGGTAAETALPSFPDVPDTHWGKAWIVEAAARGLFGGDDKGNFLPDQSIKRGDFVLVLWRMAGKPEPAGASAFADVPENAYYAKAVAWAYENGYVNGKGNGFAPQDSLTRQEAMKILFGYAGGVSGMELMLGGVYDSSYNDSSEIASWAKPAMYWAVYNKIINGMNGGLNPNGEASRAQLAKILVEYQNAFEATKAS